MTQPASITPTATRPTWRKTAIQMVIGALVGGSVTFALLMAVGKSGFEFEDPSRLLALVAGIVFALMGLVVGFGVVAPGPGAHLLNVEDADELREQRRPLWRGAIIMILTGIMMLVLALAAVDGSAGTVPRTVAGVIVAACFVVSAIVAFISRNDNDELMVAIGAEASTVSMYATTILFGVWAAFAHLGHLIWIDPLGLLAALLLLQLAAIMWVCGRRGMYRPR